MAVVVAAWMSLPTTGWAATEVNTCGQVFAGNGFLSADLDCSGFTGDAVTIQGGKLDLRGFTLTATAPSKAVFCEKSCDVSSEPPGGTITSDGSGTILAVAATCVSCLFDPPTDLQVSDVVINDGRLSTDHGIIRMFDSSVTGIVDPSGAAVAQYFGPIRLRRSVVSGNAGDGIHCPRAQIVDSEISNNGGLGLGAGFSVRMKRSVIWGNADHGISTPRSVAIKDSRISGNGQSGIDMASDCGGYRRCKMTLRNSDVSGNVGLGISAASVEKITVRDSTINDNGEEGFLQELGHSDARLKLINSTVTGNALNGVAQVETSIACNEQSCMCRLQLKGSMVAGNGLDASCGVSRTCADLASCNLPRVISTTCDTSYDTGSGFPGTSWGVCALD